MGTITKLAERNQSRKIHTSRTSRQCESGLGECKNGMEPERCQSWRTCDRSTLTSLGSAAFTSAFTSALTSADQTTFGFVKMMQVSHQANNTRMAEPETKRKVEHAARKQVYPWHRPCRHQPPRQQPLAACCRPCLERGRLVRPRPHLRQSNHRAMRSTRSQANKKHNSRSVDSIARGKFDCEGEMLGSSSQGSTSVAGLGLRWCKQAQAN